MLNKKNRIIILSVLIILLVILLVLFLIPDNRTHIPYKDFKINVSSGDVDTASINSKEILFTLKSKSRRLLH
ncbi:MAG: ATP-dependent metallopeptidase FtsH/Yme1/Tma family protein [Clostridia bacterium]|nr:ATP-dependent metallopeptidase FtsH/Yme1/Tma family protein [Clostridia bacterium]